MSRAVDHRAMSGVSANKKAPWAVVRGTMPGFWEDPYRGGDRNAIVYVFTRRHAILLLRHLAVTGKWHSHFRLTWVTGVSSKRVASTVKRLERHGLIKVKPRRETCANCPRGIRKQPGLQITESGRLLLFLVEECLHILRRHARSTSIMWPEVWGPILGWIPGKAKSIGPPIVTEVAR